MVLKQHVVKFVLLIWFTGLTVCDAARLVTKDIQYKGLSEEVRHALDFDVLSTQVGTIYSQEALENDVKWLYLTGYFSDVHATPTIQNQQVFVVYEFEENPVISDVVFLGNTTFKARELTDILHNKAGQVLNIKWIESDKNAIQSYYKSKGYTLMEVESITMEDGVMTVTIREVYIDSVRITGLKKIKPDTVLTRDLRSQPGTVFNTVHLQEDRSKLIRTGYFNTVSVPELKEDIQHGKISISMAVTERHSTAVEVGLEQEQRDVVAFTKFIKYHALIPTDELSSKLQFSNNNTTEVRLRSYNIDYYQPWLFNRFNIGFRAQTWTTFERERLSADFLDNTLKTYNTKRNGIEVGLDFPIRRDKLTFSTIYRQEKVFTTDSESTFATQKNKPETYHSNTLALLLRYTSVVNIFNPKSGMYGSFELEKGNDIGIAKLGGLDDNRQSANGAFFYSPTARSTIGLHGFVGRYQPNSAGINTFDNERFEVGGVMSMRGYKENFQFGNKKVLFNLEYRYDISRKVQGVLFYDTGRAFDGGWTLQYLNYGRGVGMRYFSPIGPFRLDVGWGEAMIIHFSLGQMF